MRIHFTYRTIEGPWGGANNFTRAFKSYLRNSPDVVFTERLEEPADIMFMNQLGQGPGSDGRKLTLREVRNACRDHRRVVVRAVNLERHAFRHGPRNLVFGVLNDRAVVKLLNLADIVVFQSLYQRDIFTAAGYRGRSNTIIHNGADPVYWNDAPPAAFEAGQLRIVSASASPRASKRHDIVAAMSRLGGVKVMHCGMWPEDVDPRNVRLIGKLDRAEMARVFAEAHFFLHPAVKDPCPNVIFEAICSGLPVLYNPGPGSSAEIVGGNGVALDLDNLADTLASAVSQLDSLRENVRATRDYYTIERAARQYHDVFRAALNGGGAMEGS